MGLGHITVSLPKLPEPTPPDGFTMSGYEVMYDGPSESTAEGKTLREAADALEFDLVDCLRVFADCTDDDGCEMTCEWDYRSKKWSAWEWK